MAYKLVPEEPKKSSISSESIHRLPTQAIKGAAATVPGIFGDVGALLNDYIAGPITEAVTGNKALPYGETTIGKLLPTTQTHQKNIEEAVPYFKPKNKIEQFVGDVASDATSLFLPSATIAKAGLRGTSATKSFLTSLGANSAGEFVSDFTGDPQKGAYTKMGTMFFLSALNKPAAKKEIGDLYQRADKLLPDTATTNTVKMEQELNSLKDRILQGRNVGDLAPSEKFVIEEADKILRQSDFGRSNVKTLKSALRSLNENLEKAVYEAPNKGTKMRAKSLATQINKSVNGALSDYGKTNPEWWKLQKGANQAFGAMSQSNFITNFIQKNLKSGSIAAELGHALGIGIGATPAIAPYQIAKILYRIAKSPELAKHYARVVSSAAAENASLMQKEAEKLDKELKKEDKKPQKFRLLD